MSNDLEKAAIRRLETKLAEMETFMRVLAEDYKFSRHVLEKDLKNQMLRRMAVRNFCAFAEGLIHGWKWTALKLHEVFKVKLADAEIAALREEAYDLKDSGQATSKPWHIGYRENFRFACAIFARVHQCSYNVDFATEGWQRVIEVFKVRDRLMHPKQSKGIEVSDAEVLVLRKASAWLQEVTISLSRSCDFAKVVENAKSNKSSELN